jgi:flagellar basal-body rod protein FlgB
MDLSQYGLFSGMTAKMNYDTQRTKVLSENIANADTPGYEAQDVTPFTFSSIFKALPLEQTNPAHIQLSSAAGGAVRETSELQQSWELKPDGNAVSTEREVKKAADTAADYEMVTNEYKKYIGIEKIVLGEGS